MTATVLVTTEQGICTLRLNRPEKKNSLTREMYDTLAAAIRAADTDPQRRVILIAANGGDFCAGNDLGDFQTRRPGDKPAAWNFLLALADTQVPLVAAVQGRAIGIGTTLLAHCDFVYAEPDASFSLPFVALGVVPEAASSQTLVQQLGYRRAAEMLLLGQVCDATTAATIGLITAVTPAGAAHATAQATAARLAALPRAALRQSKQLLRRPPESLHARLHAEIAIFQERLASATAQELIAAILEKRPPDRSKLD